MSECLTVGELRKAIKGVKSDVIVEIVRPSESGVYHTPITSVKYNPNNAFGKRVEIKSEWL